MHPIRLLLILPLLAASRQGRAAEGAAAASFPGPPLSWSVGFSESLDAVPGRFVPATVPGAVQLDWARAEKWPDVNRGDNFRAYGWMENRYWHYRARLPVGLPDRARGLFFVCRGVDYACTVRLNGKVLLDHEGMFTPFEIDLGGLANAGDLLELVVHPAPKAQPAQTTKPEMSYGWDFHPRLVPLGIWEETGLEIRPDVYLRGAELSYQLSDDFSSAGLQLDVEATGPVGNSVQWELLDPSGMPVLSRRGGCRQEARLEHPLLWWPNSEGGQPLYTSRVTLPASDGSRAQVLSQRVGFRRIRLVMGAGAWEREREVPVTQAPAPITFEVNGREIFARGANWVPPGMFPGTVGADTYRPLLDLVAGAHLDFLRLWGGGFVNKDSFFELCAERGIMLWQEFPLACNYYEGTPAYLALLDRESRSIILRLRRQTALAVWCGGNELFNAWSRMTPQSAPLRLLGRNCFDLDPARPFVPTSPVFNIRHGDYRFRVNADQDDVFSLYPRCRATAYMEFGVPGPAPVSVLKAFMPEDELFPPRRGTAWESHFGFSAWDGDRNSWLMLNQIEHYFGPSSTLEELVARGQLLQSVGLKAIYEEARRQKPRCSAAACWVFNEPWPNAASNSLVAYPAVPKPAYQAVAEANRPTMSSARVLRFDWAPGEEFAAELWLLNDSPSSTQASETDASLVIGGRSVPLGSWSAPAGLPGRNQQGPRLVKVLPSSAGETFDLLLKVRDRPEWDSRYTFAWKRAL